MPHDRGTFEGARAGHCNLPMHECIAYCLLATAGECACPNPTWGKAA